MTDVARRPAFGLLLVSPAAAVALALSTTWALDHTPPSATIPPRPESVSGASDLRLREDLTRAVADLQRSQASVLRLKAAVQARADRMRTLEPGLGALGDHAHVRAWPGGGNGAAAGQTPVQALPLVPTLAAPIVNTRTGAS